MRARMSCDWQASFEFLHSSKSSDTTSSELQLQPKWKKRTTRCRKYPHNTRRKFPHKKTANPRNNSTIPEDHRTAKEWKREEYQRLPRLPVTEARREEGHCGDNTTSYLKLMKMTMWMRLAISPQAASRPSPLGFLRIFPMYKGVWENCPLELLVAEAPVQTATDLHSQERPPHG